MLQLICGLSRRFHIMATLLPMQQPFPSFLQARSRPLLEDISITERERSTGATTLPIGHGGSSFGGGGPSGDRASPPSPTDKGKSSAIGSPSSDRQRGGRGCGRGHPGTSSNGGRVQQGQTPWMGYFAPFGAPPPTPKQWCATWTPPNAAGVLGPRLGASHQPYPTIGSSSTAPQWDSVALA
ncbi:hypothetical protein D1007_22882 [Hordeum vulgare]|nr:hypothetical protein D1007_22882 [Hordeum vulgare]